MSVSDKLYEDREIACRVLIHLISQTNDEKKRQMLLYDFIHKYRGMRDSARSYYLSKLFPFLLPPNVANMIKEEEMIEPKPRADIAIMTVKIPELYAAKIALDIGLKDDPDKTIRGYRYWKTILTSKVRDEPLHIVLTMVGRDRRVNCANACRTLFENYEVGLCVLMGIAAGPEKKVALGDVVVAKSVWDYEPMRLEIKQHRKRPEIFNIDGELRRNIEYYDLNDKGWPLFFREKLEILKKKRNQTPKEIDENWTSNFHLNIILSGDKLVANNSLEEKRSEYHEGMRALDMEASGFAPTCEEKGVPWLVFRGISDFGNPKTKDQKDSVTKSRKVWQKTAALSAATALINFIENEYRTGQDTHF